MHTLETSVELPCDISTTFAFFAEAANLQRITPPELHFQILTPLPLELHAGARIDYRLRLGPLPFTWRTVITAWDPPALFVDEQESGPYALWIHSHRFESTPGGTVITDTVRYRLPLWPAGEIAYPFVERQLARIFGYRQAAVRAALVPPPRP